MRTESRIKMTADDAATQPIIITARGRLLFKLNNRRAVTSIVHNPRQYWQWHHAWFNNVSVARRQLFLKRATNFHE